MKLLPGQHLSRRLVLTLEASFPGSSHVVAHSLDARDDNAIWEFARAGGFAIVTKGEDIQVLSFARGHPPKGIWMKSGNGPMRQVLEILTRARVIILTFGEDDGRSLLVLP